MVRSSKKYLMCAAVAAMSSSAWQHCHAFQLASVDHGCAGATINSPRCPARRLSCRDMWSPVPQPCRAAWQHQKFPRTRRAPLQAATEEIQDDSTEQERVTLGAVVERMGILRVGVLTAILSW